MLQTDVNSEVNTKSFNQRFIKITRRNTGCRMTNRSTSLISPVHDMVVTFKCMPSIVVKMASSAKVEQARRVNLPVPNHRLLIASCRPLELKKLCHTNQI